MAKKASSTKSSTRRSTSGKKSTTSTKSSANSVVAEFSYFGLAFREVGDVLVSEVQKLPPNRASAVSKLALDFDDRCVANGKRYVAASQKNDTASKKAIRQEEYLLECLFVNNLMRLGCSGMIEKIQAEAQKHTKPGPNGKKPDMFSVIRHNYIYYPSDIALMKKKGYDFNALHTINGKKMDFTTYNLGILTSSAAKLEACNKEMYEAVKAVQEERNALIEKYEKLEAEKKKASASRRKQIDQEIEKLNTEYKRISRQIDLARAKGDVIIEEFIAARQRLLKAVELGVLTPENVAKIEQAHIPQLVDSFQKPYAQFMRLKKAVYKEDAVSQTTKRQTPTKDNSKKTGVNAVLAGTNTYSPKEQEASIPPLQLGMPIDAQNNTPLVQINMDNLSKA
ncbi:MAG: hypothetical protein IJY92_02680 [Alphaproteobacteria bacterium]|nr:hypothetical protein [Alphaproteobacteria bacterium]